MILREPIGRAAVDSAAAAKGQSAFHLLSSCTLSLNRCFWKTADHQKCTKLGLGDLHAGSVQSDLAVGCGHQSSRCVVARFSRNRSLRRPVVTSPFPGCRAPTTQSDSDPSKTMTTYFNYPSEELQVELAAIAKAIVAPGKGEIIKCL